MFYYIPPIILRSEIQMQNEVSDFWHYLIANESIHVDAIDYMMNDWILQSLHNMTMV